MNARNTTMLIMRDISEAEKEKLINSIVDKDCGGRGMTVQEAISDVVWIRTANNQSYQAIPEWAK